MLMNRLIRPMSCGNLQEAWEYNPHRPRPTDLDGLRTNLRHRDGRWYWHWDPKFIDGTSALPPIEVTEVDRMYAAVEAILRNGVPMLSCARPDERSRHQG